MKAMKAMKAMKRVGKAGKAMAKGEIFGAIESSAGVKRKEVKAVFESLGSLIPTQLKATGKFTIPGITMIKLKKKPATKAGKRMAFGKEVFVKAKPAKTVVKCYTVKAMKAETTPVAKKVSALQSQAKTATTMKRFEQVQKDIDQMEDDLREEGMEDIKIKAHCDNERREVNNHQESLEFDMDALQKEMDSGEAKKKLLAKQIQHTTTNMQKLKKEMEEYLNTRNAQNEAFKTALKADNDAVMLLAKAIEALSKYATNNKLSMLQKKQEPEYTTSADTAPEATFSSASSGGSESGGIVSIIENIKQDLEEEMDKAKEEEAKALQSYKDTLKESQDSMAAMEKKIASMEVEIAETTKLVADKQQTYDDKKKAHDNNEKYLAEIATECDWMDENFDPRKTARDSEIEGLDDAKGALAGEKQLGLIVASKRMGGKRPSVDEELKELDETETEESLNFLQRSRA